MGKGLGRTQRAILTYLRKHAVKELQYRQEHYPGARPSVEPVPTAQIAEAVGCSSRQVLQAAKGLEARGLIKSDRFWSHWLPTTRRTAPLRTLVPLEAIDSAAVERARRAAEEELSGWVPEYVDRWGRRRFPENVRVAIQVWDEGSGEGAVIERPVMSRCFWAVLPTGVRVEDIGPAWVGEYRD